jgi:hypothetical protein
VLFVGPHQAYLAYVSDVLPSLGEEGVQTATLRDLVAEGAAAAVEADPDVARLKSSADLVKAVEPAVRFYEKPPARGMTVGTYWSDIWLSAEDWSEAFEAPDPGTPHNEARDQIWEQLLAILTDKHDGDVPADLLRKSLLQNRDLHTALNRKGLEFDLVILVDSEAFGEGIEGAVDRYVAMTRATQQLVILTSS